MRISDWSSDVCSSDLSAAKPATAAAPTRDAAQRTQLSASGKPMRTQPPSVSASGQPEQIKGVRRNMARVMAGAHAKVVATTLSDDADIRAWAPGNDRSEEHTSELQSLMRISYAGFRLKTKTTE